MAYPNDEKETTCIYDYTTKEWIVYTCVPKHINKLLKSCGEPFWKEEEQGEKEIRIVAGKWRLKGNQVRFNRPIVPKKGKDDE